MRGIAVFVSETFQEARRAMASRPEPPRASQQVTSPPKAAKSPAWRFMMRSCELPYRGLPGSVDRLNGKGFAELYCSLAHVGKCVVDRHVHLSYSGARLGMFMCAGKFQTGLSKFKWCADSSSTKQAHLVQKHIHSQNRSHSWLSFLALLEYCCGSQLAAAPFQAFP